MPDTASTLERTPKHCYSCRNWHSPEGCKFGWSPRTEKLWMKMWHKTRWGEESRRNRDPHYAFASDCLKYRCLRGRAQYLKSMGVY